MSFVPLTSSSSEENHNHDGDDDESCFSEKSKELLLLPRIDGIVRITKLSLSFEKCDVIHDHCVCG